MITDLMEILACPADHGELTIEITVQEGNDVVTGTLTCTVCDEIYPIVESIPNLLPAELRQ